MSFDNQDVKWEYCKFSSLLYNFDIYEHDDFEKDFIDLIDSSFAFAIKNYPNKMKIHKMYEWNTVVASFCNSGQNAMEKNKTFLKSEKIAEYFLNLLKDKKWQNSRGKFLDILLIKKDKKRIAYAAKNIPSLWKAEPYVRYVLTEAVYKLKIPNFCKQMQKMLEVAQKEGDKQMQNFAKRYLANEHKYKPLKL